MEGLLKIITISREFGSGGRSIAKAVADKLGIAYYDKELVRQGVTETGYAEELLNKKGNTRPLPIGWPMRSPSAAARACRI